MLRESAAKDAVTLIATGSEVSLAVAISGHSVLEYISGRDPVSGSVYRASVLLYGALPWLHARRSRGSISHEA